ncbi:OsmC family protein [Paenibacillus sp. CGMCC 1.16610]|uniref:OsmC family peroxiredoxin n=1 Tax=Paenibacillus anseongense TaxID=2682845 RepID=A0ABW9UIJ4_9BACL|nr:MULTISPECIES: OsmC family protein [Paenibacillus]MBA2939487.1 OsmC family protein [Paenibacillus sp. CGMCC 1.16610]MVQ39151.1 OsmC family peroxiredoxin [Paenibacillus anseongense]
MSTLNEYLIQKKAAGAALREKAAQDPKPNVLKAQARAAGRSGIREIRIRDFQIISDSPENFAGYNLGPSSPELQLGVLSSCITHIALIQASERGVTLESLEVEVTGEQHPLAGKPGYEDVPIYPHNIQYKLYITSNESPETIAALHEAIERVCPIYNLLKNPQEIQGEVVHKTVQVVQEA